MTSLNRPLRRIVRDREGGMLTVTLHPEGLEIRVKGQRVRYPLLPFGMLLLQAAKLHVAAEKRNGNGRTK